MQITLHYTPSTRAIRPRWLLEELDVSYQLKTLDLFAGKGNTPEYKAIHPLGYVPALEINGQIQLESGAMCQWLADHFIAAGLAPTPGDPPRIKYQQWMYFTPGTLEPPAWLILMHSRVLPEEQRVDSIIPWASERYQGILEVVNDALDGRSYLVDDSFTAADIMTGSTLMWVPETLENFPDLQAYVERLQQRDAFKRASA